MTVTRVRQAPILSGRLDGRVALVTGGGSGLGAEIVAILAEEGAAVVGADVRPEAAEAVAQRIRAAGGRAVGEPLDVRDGSAARRLVDTIVDREGRLDILVNDAGTDITAPFDEIDPRDWDRVIDVNLRGPANLIRAALPALRRSGSGQIVNIASTAAKRTWPNASAYHASKWGLLGLSHALHAELRPAGIRVTAVICGGMRTPFLLQRFPDIDVSTLQEPRTVALAIRDLLLLPEGSVVAELTVLPLGETSWP
jgi:NAD(P)-dependent dehydrogenase (short-subunit alcohol dehydrogenase family)